VLGSLLFMLLGRVALWAAPIVVAAILYGVGEPRTVLRPAASS
jgi:hypothetical protein